MIAISVTNYNDINLAKAFIKSYEKKDEVYIHFATSSWIHMFGKVDFKHGSDLEYFLFHSYNFDLLLTFSAPPNNDQKYNYILVSCFNSLGIETVEIQHGLFQYGFNNIDDVLKCGFNDYGKGWGLKVEYPAKNTLTWYGENGIGYLKSNFWDSVESKLFDKDFTLIITNNNWHIYNDYDKFNFINCLVKLVDKNKNDLFVWKPHPAELKDDTVKVIEEYKFSNLKILGSKYIVEYPSERLVKECKYGISMISTSLLDFEYNNKQTLVYEREVVKKMISQLEVIETFDKPNDLVEKYFYMKRDNSSYKLKTGIKPLNIEKLNDKINIIRNRSQSNFDSRIILEYLDRLAYTRIPDPNKYIIQRDFRIKNSSHNNINIKSIYTKIKKFIKMIK